MSGEQMKALWVASLGGPSAVRLETVPVPPVRPGTVRVRIAACGINFADVAQSRGTYVGGPRPPYIPGVEAAGEIVEVGPGVQGWSVGQPVIAMGGGAFAEQGVFSARSLLPVPPGWSMAQAAAMPVQWLTAHGCLRTVGQLVPGETVLIHAVAGGVGLAALRLAKHFGATVIGTASSEEKLDVARARGLDHGINTATQDFLPAVQELTGGRGADLVLEMVGGDTFRRSLQATRPYGRLVVYGAASNEAANVNNVQLIFQPVAVLGYHLTVLMTRRPDLFAAELEEVRALIAAGVFVPEAPATWSLADGAAALHALEQRQTTGKLVLVP